MNHLEQNILGLFVKTNGVLSKLLYGGLGHIFMLHRVLPENLRNKYTFNRDLAITPDYLEEIIIYLKNNNFQFISLDTLHEILTENHIPKQKFICFTLDDGYKDNLDYGLPIFQKHNIPFTIYITNCFPNHTANFWWYLLEEKINNNPYIVWKNNKLVIDNEGEKQKIYNQISIEIKKMEIQKTNDFFANELEILRPEFKKIALSWSEIKELANHNLITIGAHTINHLSLKYLSENEVQNEIVNSKNELKINVGKEIHHFAYPYGGFNDANSREYQTAKKNGFKTSVINHPGNIFQQHKNSLMALPRYPLGNNTNKQKLETFFNGIQHFSCNQFTKIVNY